MSEFDRENEDVFQIVHGNPRRRGVIRDVGYIINQEQAQRFSAYEAAQKRRGADSREFGIFAISLFISVVILVYQLVR